MNKILIVDDELDAREVISRYLAKKGFGVSTAANGREAIDKLLKEKPDLILLDIRMPDMDGIECLRLIRELDKEVLVIMSTAVTEEDIAKHALELGATDYITKPLSLDTIHTAISVYLFQNNLKS